MKKNATALMPSIDAAPLAAGVTAALLFLATPVGWDLVVGRHAPAADPVAALTAAAPPPPWVDADRGDAPADHGVDIAATAPPARDTGPYPDWHPAPLAAPLAAPVAAPRTAPAMPSGAPAARPVPATMAMPGGAGPVPAASMLLAGLRFQAPQPISGADGAHDAAAGVTDAPVALFPPVGPGADRASDPAADAAIAASVAQAPPPRLPAVLGAPLMVALEAGQPVIRVLFAPPTARALPIAPLDKSTDRVVTVDSADKLVEVFDGENFSWHAVREGETEEVPRLFVSAFPEDIDEIDTIDLRKRVFFDSLLPLVLAVNERILDDRARLDGLFADLAAGVPPGAADGAWLADTARYYETDTLELDDLRVRMDIVPPSMALAQAAVESGWGTSGLARNGNALFGQIVASGDDGIPAADGDHGFAAFETLKDSAAAYIRNLNTHPAYADFRAARAAQRVAGEWPDGYRLIGELTAYSELGKEYIDYVRVVIRANDLQGFDRTRLRPLPGAQAPHQSRPRGPIVLPMSPGAGSPA